MTHATPTGRHQTRACRSQSASQSPRRKQLLEEAGFEFEEFQQSVKTSLSATLQTLTRSRDELRDAHVENDLNPSEGLTNTEQNGLPFADVPFLLTACSDTLNQTTATNLGVGDYGFVGLVYSSTTVQPSDTRKDLCRLDGKHQEEASSQLLL